MFISPINVQNIKFTSGLNSKKSSVSVASDRSYDALKLRLDNYKGDFITPSGKKISGNVKDYLKACMLKDIKTIDAENMLHGTSTKEVRDKIMRNGFSVNFVSRTQAGPGICFTGDEHIANILGGSSLIRADFKGNSTTFEHGFFQNIKDNEEFTKAVEKVMYDTGAGMGFSQTINRYVRDVLIEDLGIDAALDPGKFPTRPQAFVVYNTSKIFNIRPYEKCSVCQEVKTEKRVEAKQGQDDDVPPNQRSYYWGY